MAAAIAEKPATRLGRPAGTKNKPGSKKPGPKPKKNTLPKPASKVAKLPDYIQRRSDLAGSDIGLDLTSFGGRLAHLRLKDKVPQDEIAKAIGRTRQMIHEYESGNSVPSFEVVEALAHRLGVSASYLMFGEHAVKVAQPDAVFNIDEISYGRDGKKTTGSFIIPRTLAESYVEDIRSLKVYSLNHNAPLFNLRAGDRLFVDKTVDTMSIEHDIYVVEIGGEMEVVRYEPTPAKGKIGYVNPSNVMIEAKAGEIKVLGALVSTLSRH